MSSRQSSAALNHIYGREPGFEEHAEAALEMGKKAARLYVSLRRDFLSGVMPKR